MSQRIYNRVLVPTDFRPVCREAYRTAFAIALASETPITLLHVLPPPDPEAYRGLNAVRLLHLAAERSMNKLATLPTNSPEALAACHGRLRAEIHPEWATAINLRTEVRCGKVVTEIARYAEEAGVDLIVMVGSRPGLLPPFSRRMADQVARFTPVKVLRITPPAFGSHRVQSRVDENARP